jgi:thiosulfate/3-mercaptopyruvate sulfurtransferase
LELYEKIYVKPAFLESDHGQIACEDCHGGDPADANWQTAHTALVKDPTFPDPTAACGECHAEIAAATLTSLHYTLKPMKQAILKRVGREHTDTWSVISKAMDKHCLTCHASCGQCHISRPEYAGGGLLAAHRFVKTPAMDTTCASCHGGRVHSEYTGARDNYEADVHYADEEMTCMHCHTADEMHAAAQGVVSRFHLSGRPACEDCHDDTVSDRSSNRSHAVHHQKVACQVCHAQAGKSCFSCHVGTDKKGLPYYKCKEGRMMLKIGLNPAKSEERPYDFVLVRHPPIIPQTFDAYIKEGLKHFDELPTWKLDTPHSIQRITHQNRTCNSCHGNAGLFLSKTDLAPWEIAANRAVVVPAGRIPAPVDDTSQ